MDSIFIIERNEWQADAIKKRLEKEGFRADISSTDTEAIEMLPRNGYRLLLTEHNPPEIDCFKLLNFIAENNLDIPVLVMLSWGEKEIASFLKKGVFEVIRKTPDMSFIDALPYHIYKALENAKLNKEKKEAEIKLRRESVISEAIIQKVINGIIFINNQGIIEKVNETLNKFLGESALKPGKNICDLPDDHLIRQLFLKPLELGICWEIEECNNHECPAYGRKDCLCWLTRASSFCHDNVASKKNITCSQCEIYRNAREKYYNKPMEIKYNRRFFHVYRKDVMDEEGMIIGEILDFVDMTAEKTYQEHLLSISITDALTGLHNRRYLMDRLIEEFYESKRYKQELSLMILDIDDFKLVNDIYGHPAGDVVLRELAVILRNEARKSDIAGRYGGEEFVIILPNTYKEEAFLMAERIRGKIQLHKFDILRDLYHVTVSIGLTSFDEKIRNVDEMIKAADKALYAAKSQGKNRTVAV